MSKKTETTSGATSAQNRREQLRLKQEAEARQQRTMRIIGIAAALLALVVVAVVGVVLVQNNRNKVEAASAQGTPVNANADKSGIVVNPGKAKSGTPVVTVYLDYQCPICKQAETTVGPALEALAEKGDISLEYRTMKFMDTNLSNTASTRAAVAAACSDNQGVYAKYHDEIYANQAQQEVQGSEGYSDKLLKETIPAAVGLTGEKLTSFQQCYDAQATLDFVKGTDDKAGAAGVTSTPTFKVNGNQIDWTTLGTTEESALAAIKTAA